ncbi:hypothetical protein V8F20_012778 [Naviculisporaceae sp. PSN 640]
MQSTYTREGQSYSATDRPRDNTRSDMQAQKSETSPLLPEKAPQRQKEDIVGDGTAAPHHTGRSLRGALVALKEFCTGLNDYASPACSTTSENQPKSQLRRLWEQENQDHAGGGVPVVGHWRQPGPRDTISEMAHCATYYRYHLTSRFFPVGHHYTPDRGAKTPWAIKVVLMFHSLDDFAGYYFRWRENLNQSYVDGVFVDWKFQPSPNGKCGTMWCRSLKLEFLLRYRRFFQAWVYIWARDPALLDDGFRVDKMITKDTCVEMQVLRVDDRAETAPLCPRQRVFYKYPPEPSAKVSGTEATEPPTDPPPSRISEGPNLPLPQRAQFCVDRDMTLDVDDPKLRHVFERTIERQLFGG